MPVFNWQDSAAEKDADPNGWTLQNWEALISRFDSAIGAVGVANWAGFVAQVRELAIAPQSPLDRDAELRATLDTFVQRLRLMPPIRRLTAFISHQRLDAPLAERAAWIANQAHLDYWLDIHDPKLAAANASVLTPVVNPFSSPVSSKWLSPTAPTLSPCRP